MIEVDDTILRVAAYLRDIDPWWINGPWCALMLWRFCDAN